MVRYDDLSGLIGQLLLYGINRRSLCPSSNIFHNLRRLNWSPPLAHPRSRSAVWLQVEDSGHFMVPKFPKTLDHLLSNHTLILRARGSFFALLLIQQLNQDLSSLGSLNLVRDRLALSTPLFFPSALF